MAAEARSVRPTRGAVPAALVYGAAVLVVASLGGLATSAGQGAGGWYADADKPFFTPPGWLFGPVWTVLFVLLDLVVALLVVRAWRVDRVAAWLLVPYLGWILFATALNASIAAMN